MRLNKPKAAKTSLQTIWLQKNIISTVAVSSVVFVLVLVQFSSVPTNRLNNNSSIFVDRASIRHAANTSSTKYSWIGKGWFPPSGVPYLSPLDLRLLFQKENTLWWGDSTARQDYETMNDMINADNIHNIPLGALNRNINKGKYTKLSLHCRNWNQTPDDICFDMGQVTGTEITNYDSMTNANATSNHTSSSSHASIGKFDLVRNPSMACLKQYSSTIRTTASFLQREYSVVILSLGIWEVARPWDCRSANTSETPAYFLNELLDAFELISGSSLYIIWKTNGPSENENGNRGNHTIALIKNAQDWFASHNPLYMGLADFGTAVIQGNRSFGSNRISGDLKPHWGLEARLLSIQMAGHLIQTKQKQTLNER
jgi:hypothetical protein